MITIVYYQMATVSPYWALPEYVELIRYFKNVNAGISRYLVFFTKYTLAPKKSRKCDVKTAVNCIV
jgi:hypothetical protein